MNAIYELVRTGRKKAIRTLLVEPDNSVRLATIHALNRDGIEAIGVSDGASALHVAQRTPVDVIVVGLPAHGSFLPAFLDELKTRAPQAALVVTGPEVLPEGTDDEEQFDFVLRDVDGRMLARAVRRAADYARLRATNAALAAQQEETAKHIEPSAPRGSHGADASTMLIGKSKAIEEVRRLVAQVAGADVTVLIQGESGVGKDVVARLLHESSPYRVNGELVKINCPAVPEPLLESELFGHEAGAFTGAQTRKLGRFEIAGGGSAFLDEIGELPLTVQAKLLQVLEQKQFVRVGGTETIQVKARIIAATNAPLQRMIQNGQFRPDLYYRLNQFTIHVPPLRERVEDIPLLAEHFIAQYADLYGKARLPLSPALSARLMSYAWPGNVRELESVIRRYVLAGDEDVVYAALEPVENAQEHLGPGRCQQAEKTVIMATLTEARWNRRAAARTLGISYNTLRRRITQYQLDRETVGPLG